MISSKISILSNPLPDPHTTLFTRSFADFDPIQIWIVSPINDRDPAHQ